MKKLIALLLCGLLLCGCAPLAPATEPVTEPPAEMVTETVTEAPTEPVTEPTLVSITIYHGNQNADGFETAEFMVEEITADILMEKLIEVGVLDAEVVLNALDDQGGHLELDFNSAFADRINAMGTSGDRMLMGSVVNTFLTAFNKVDKVSITVSGEILESGHVVYDEPMGFFE